MRFLRTLRVLGMTTAPIRTLAAAVHIIVFALSWCRRFLTGNPQCVISRLR